MMICVYEFYFDERDVDYANKSYIYIYICPSGNLPIVNDSLFCTRHERKICLST